MARREFIVGTDKKGHTLQSFLAVRIGLSRNRAKELIDQRGTFVNGRRVWMAHHALQRGDRVEINIADSAAVPSPSVLLEDDSLLIVDKPAGILANGADSVETMLQTARPAVRIQSVHRLDRDTTGCLLLAKSPAVFDAMVAIFRDGQVKKMYHVLVAGRLPQTNTTIREPIDNQPAVTHFRVLDTNNQASHLMVRIETGRTHQIRKHMAAMQHPVLGDKSYNGRGSLVPLMRGVPRQMLHAYAIEFAHPVTHAIIRVEAPLPRDFKQWMGRLRLT
jgi:23S rRNA pseudouridine1911/1915/1917 synthase